MPIGNAPVMGDLNQKLVTYTTALRLVCQQIQALQAFCTAQGQAGLVTLGFTAADATSFINSVSFLNTIAGIYFGLATQASSFNFNNALSPVILAGG